MPDSTLAIMRRELSVAADVINKTTDKLQVANADLVICAVQGSAAGAGMGLGYAGAV